MRYFKTEKRKKMVKSLFFRTLQINWQSKNFLGQKWLLSSEIIRISGLRGIYITKTLITDQFRILSTFILDIANFLKWSKNCLM